MKYLHAIIASTLILASCGGEKKTSSIEDVINSGNLKEIRAKKKEIEDIIQSPKTTKFHFPYFTENEYFTIIKTTSS